MNDNKASTKYQNGRDRGINEWNYRKQLAHTPVIMMSAEINIKEWINKSVFMVTVFFLAVSARDKNL